MQYSEQKIKEFISELADALEIEEENISVNSKLSELNWDSLAIISAISIADKCFDVVISIEKLAECKTINDIINIAYVE
tara:strand:+ start:415 stop:651 length:237 start_codon:yes stop_codon:yes gene_type:complete